MEEVDSRDVFYYLKRSGLKLLALLCLITAQGRQGEEGTAMKFHHHLISNITSSTRA